MAMLYNIAQLQYLLHLSPSSKVALWRPPACSTVYVTWQFRWRYARIHKRWASWALFCFFSLFSTRLKMLGFLHPCCYFMCHCVIRNDKCHDDRLPVINISHQIFCVSLRSPLSRQHIHNSAGFCSIHLKWHNHTWHKPGSPPLSDTAGGPWKVSPCRPYTRPSTSSAWRSTRTLKILGLYFEQN